MTDETRTPANPSRPITRAKRHLRVVTASPEADKHAGEEQAQGGRGATGEGKEQGGSIRQAEGATKKQGRKGRGPTQRSAPDPITGLTEKQTKFAEGVSSGMSLSDAYRAAYVTDNMTPKQVWEEASSLAAHPKVSRRLEQIALEKERQRRMLAPADAAAALEVLRRMMERADSDATKVRAAELLAKAAGVFTDKVEIEDKTDRSASEIEHQIADRLRRLGLAS